MNLCVSFGWIVTAGANLEWKVEAVLLFLRAELSYQVKTFFPKEQITRVTQVGCVENRGCLVEGREDTSAATHLMVVVNCVNQDVFWAHFISVIVLKGQISNTKQSFIKTLLLLAKPPGIISRINIVLGPSTDAISHREHPVSQHCGIFAALVSLLHVWQHKHATFVGKTHGTCIKGRQCPLCRCYAYPP